MKKSKYDFYVKNISKDPKDPAYEAYIPSIDTTVFGNSFKELEEGIKFSFECEEIDKSKKYKIRVYNKKTIKKQKI